MKVHTSKKEMGNCAKKNSCKFFCFVVYILSVFMSYIICSWDFFTYCVWLSFILLICTMNAD